MFNRYYQDELAFLREMGAEFARANPAAAPFLAEPGADPDVERLLQGFAFLAGRVRQKLDDEFPELTQGLVELLWPHYLRPVPGYSIVQFEPLPQMVRGPMTVERGAEMLSAPVDGTACPFRTTAPVRLLPLVLEDAAVEHPAGSAGRLRLALRLTSGAKPGGWDLSPLRLFLHGDATLGLALYQHLLRRVRSVVLRAGQKVIRQLGPECVVPGGFGDDEALLPFPPASFPGFRLLGEYFTLPQKFLFVDVLGLPGPEALGEAGTFELLFEFADAPDPGLRLGPENVRLHAAPVANLFTADSEPLRVDHERAEYRLRVAGVDPEHAEVFSVDGVSGWIRGTTAARPYPSFTSFTHAVEPRDRAETIYYQPARRPSVRDGRVDTFLSFVTGDAAGAAPPSETVTARLTCTNRGLPSRLKIGDIARATDLSPTFARFRNIVPVTPGYAPPLGGELHWRLMAHLALNQLSLAEPGALAALLHVYDIPALYDRQAARRHALRTGALLKVERAPEEILHRGAPLRGTRFTLDIDEDGFAGPGDVLLFGSVLDAFLGLYATLNSFCRLVVRGTKQGDVVRWAPRLGNRPLV